MTMGHNSIPRQLDMAAHDARLALGKTEQADTDKMAAWVSYGAALLVGKKLTKDPNCGIAGKNPDERFHKWLVSHKLQDTISGEVGRNEQAAAIWAAEDKERYEQAQQDYANVRTVRGLHDKWRNAQKPKPKPQPSPTQAPPQGTSAPVDPPVDDGDDTPDPAPTDPPEPDDNVEDDNVEDDNVEDDDPIPAPTPSPQTPQKTDRKDAIMRIVAASASHGFPRRSLQARLEKEGVLPPNSDANLVRQVVSSLLFEDELIIDEGLLRLKEYQGPPPVLSQSAQQKLDAAKRRMVRDFEYDVMEKAREIHTEWAETYTKNLNKKVVALRERVDVLLTAKRGGKKLTPQEYRTLKKALAPQGNKTPDLLREAWEIFQSLGIEPLTDKEIEELEMFEKRSRELNEAAGL